MPPVTRYPAFLFFNNLSNIFEQHTSFELLQNLLVLHKNQHSKAGGFSSLNNRQDFRPLRISVKSGIRTNILDTVSNNASRCIPRKIAYCFRMAICLFIYFSKALLHPVHAGRISERNYRYYPTLFLNDHFCVEFVSCLYCLPGKHQIWSWETDKYLVILSSTWKREKWVKHFWKQNISQTGKEYNTKSTYTVYIVELCFSRSQQAFFYSNVNRGFTKITGKWIIIIFFSTVRQCMTCEGEKLTFCADKQCS